MCQVDDWLCGLIVAAHPTPIHSVLVEPVGFVLSGAAYIDPLSCEPLTLVAAHALVDVMALVDGKALVVAKTLVIRFSNSFANQNETTVDDAIRDLIRLR